MVISAKDHESIEFQVTQDMVDAFAHLSGDYNAMHMDNEVARKSRFRRRIVHGMLPLSFVSAVQQLLPEMHLRFIKLSAHFNKPVYVGDLISLKIKLDEKGSGIYAFRGEWKRQGTGELLLIAKGKIRQVSEPGAETCRKLGDGGFLLHGVEENQYTIDELEEQQERLEFEISPDLAGQYLQQVLSSDSQGYHGFCPNLAATLLLSTMVGMRLPGRYATFTRFNIEFENNIEYCGRYEMLAQLSGVSKGAEHIEAAVSIMDSRNSLSASGSYEVVLNSPPKIMPECKQIRKHHTDMGLSGKVALVVGSSRGIGETTAKLLSMLGTKTVVTYMHGKSDAQRIVSDIMQEGGEAIAVQCDITSNEQVNSMVKTVIESYSSIDILVNNAVREFSPRDVLDLSWQDFLDELEVSVKGLHACCKAVIPLFKKQGHGKIINLSTIAVDNPVAGQSRYITAKSAVEGYTKSLAVELSQHGIQVNLVVPNMTDTDLVSVIPATFRERIAESRPYKRHIDPIEVAQSVAYLAGNWSNAMTGQKIVLNLGEPPFA